MIQYRTFEKNGHFNNNFYRIPLNISSFKHSRCFLSVSIIVQDETIDLESFSEFYKTIFLENHSQNLRRERKIPGI